MSLILHFSMTCAILQPVARVNRSPGAVVVVVGPEVVEAVTDDEGRLLLVVLNSRCRRKNEVDAAAGMADSEVIVCAAIARVTADIFIDDVNGASVGVCQVTLLPDGHAVAVLGDGRVVVAVEVDVDVVVAVAVGQPNDLDVPVVRRQRGKVLEEKKDLLLPE